MESLPSGIDFDERVHAGKRGMALPGSSSGFSTDASVLMVNRTAGEGNAATIKSGSLLVPHRDPSYDRRIGPFPPPWPPPKGCG